jgi:hypothetical protein
MGAGADASFLSPIPNSAETLLFASVLFRTGKSAAHLTLSGKIVRDTRFLCPYDAGSFDYPGVERKMLKTEGSTLHLRLQAAAKKTAMGTLTKAVPNAAPNAPQ